MAEEECILCYDPLDVPVFEGNTTDDIIVGATSSRLQCGHAYHTTCVLRALQHRASCPLCSMVRENDEGVWDRRIALEGRCMEIMEKVKKDKEVREAMREYKASMKSMMDVKKPFLKRVKDFKTELRAEMGVDEKVKAVMKSKTSAMRIFSRKAKNEGTMIAGAVNILPTYKIEQFLFGLTRFFRWRMRHVFN